MLGGCYALFLIIGMSGFSKLHAGISINFCKILCYYVLLLAIPYGMIFLRHPYPEYDPTSVLRASESGSLDV
jgi:hypothetical protein